MSNRMKPLVKVHALCYWRAFSISTQWHHCNLHIQFYCVNALLRAFSISTFRIVVYYFCFSVSMPFFGLSPFLLILLALFLLYQQNVSMPFFGLSPFLQETVYSLHAGTECVNALLRAFSISTVAKQKMSKDKKEVSMPFFGLSPFLLVLVLLSSWSWLPIH